MIAKLKPLPSREFMSEWLDYNPDTGLFRWKKQPKKCCRPLIGRVAGTRTERGYIALKPGDGNVYAAHRLAWVWVHGSIPEGLYIDHIDGNPSNNAISNLRLATALQNQHNMRKHAATRVGLKGVKYETSTTHRSQNKWRSQINVNGKRIDLGCHPSAEQAHQAYREAAIKYFGSYARFE
jgi:hypothetical protein